MTDIFSSEKRSEIMSKIRSTGTKLESKGFAVLKVGRFRFRRHPKGIFGNPDAANKSRKIALFFDSEFWHGFAFDPQKTPNEFWRSKIGRNMVRDKLVNKTLAVKGWVVLRFWEHELKKEPLKVIKKIKSVYNKQ